MATLTTSSQLPEPDTPELDYLREQIRSGLERQEKLTQAAVSSFIDCLENSIHLGWKLQDAFTLTGNRKWKIWVENNLSVSVDRVGHLRKLGTFFDRHTDLHAQIVNTGVQSGNQLLELLGLRSRPKHQPKPVYSVPLLNMSPGGTNANRPAVVMEHTRQQQHGLQVSDAVDALVSDLEKILPRLDVIISGNLPFGNRQKLIGSLAPLARIFESMRSALI